MATKNKTTLKAADARKISTVTLAKGGKGERKVEIAHIHIPDLWHIATELDVQGIKTQGDENAGDLVRQVWHLAHDLKREIDETSGNLKFALEVLLDIAKHCDGTGTGNMAQNCIDQILESR